MSNLTQRLITGTIFVIVLVGCIWWSAWTLMLLCFAVTVLGLQEFYKLARKVNAEPLNIYGVVLGGLLILGTFLAHGSGAEHLYLLFIPLFFLIFFVELFRKKANPFGNIAWTFIGLIYVALPMVMLMIVFTPFRFLAQYVGYENLTSPYDFKEPLLLFVLIWISDSLAYVCGRLFGKHKLWERISPKKTWEGFIGGMIFTIATGYMVAHLIFEDRNTLHSEITWSLVGFTISLTGMLGDLTESMFKRSIDVKDSGTILPGHGGILDRFDALFLATPFGLTVFLFCEAAR